MRERNSPAPATEAGRGFFLSKGRVADLLFDRMQPPARAMTDAALLHGKGFISAEHLRATVRQHGGHFLNSDGSNIPAWHIVCRSASAAAYSARGSKSAPGYPWEGHQFPPVPPQRAYKGYAATITAFVGYAAAVEGETVNSVVWAAMWAADAWAKVEGQDANTARQAMRQKCENILFENFCL